MTDYGGKAFNDPIVRCEQCTKITHRSFLSKHGGCYHCGNRRVTNVHGMQPEEYYGLENGDLVIGIEKPYTIDPDFLALFEQVMEVPE